jgi:two-component system sensor histidine kinase VanS
MIKKKFSIKIFIGITCILLAIGLLVFIILRIFMPKIYETQLTEQFTKNAESFVVELESEPMTEWTRLLMEFCVRNNTNSSIFNEDGQKVATFKASIYTTADDGTETPEENTYTSKYTITVNGDDKPYTLIFYFNNEPIDQVTNSFEKMFPILFGVIFIISLLISFFYTRFVMSIKNLQLVNEKLQSDIEDERRRRDFFSAISHELKTPVTILKGELDGMILGVGKFKDRDKYLQEAYETTESIEKLVSEIMAAAKLDMVKMTREEINLSELTQDCLLKIDELINVKYIRIEQDFSDTKIFADKKLMSIVISNIIGNAVKHSPQGTEVDLRFNENGEFSVKNHGVNIGENSPESDISGGLGLYIVKSILELHGFKHSFENTEDGTKFTIIFT